MTVYHIYIYTFFSVQGIYHGSVMVTHSCSMAEADANTVSEYWACARTEMVQVRTSGEDTALCVSMCGCV